EAAGPRARAKSTDVEGRPTRPPCQPVAACSCVPPIGLEAPTYRGGNRSAPNDAERGPLTAGWSPPSRRGAGTTGCHNGPSFDGHSAGRRRSAPRGSASVPCLLPADVGRLDVARTARLFSLLERIRLTTPVSHQLPGRAEVAEHFACQGVIAAQHPGTAREGLFVEGDRFSHPSSLAVGGGEVAAGDQGPGVVWAQ